MHVTASLHPALLTTFYKIRWKLYNYDSLASIRWAGGSGVTAGLPREVIIFAFSCIAEIWGVMLLGMLPGGCIWLLLPPFNCGTNTHSQKDEIEDLLRWLNFVMKTIFHDWLDPRFLLAWWNVFKWMNLRQYYYFGSNKINICVAASQYQFSYSLLFRKLFFSHQALPAPEVDNSHTAFYLGLQYLLNRLN